MINRICISLIFFITSLLSSLSGKELDIRDKELIEKEQAYQKILQKILEDSKDKEMMIGVGKKLYGHKCIFCHGEDGRGREGFAADLTKRISFKSALNNIQKGGKNFIKSYPVSMPPMIADDKRASVVAEYVSSGFLKNEKAEYLFKKIGCVNCHGEDGTGHKFYGPNIRSFDIATVSSILRGGKKSNIGIMPRFKNLSPYQITALSLYVISLGETK